MAQTIQLKRSSVAGNIPGTSDLALGEIAINTADGAVYIKTGNDDIVAVADDGILHIDTTNSRVGIGTTSPSEKLHVDGNIKTTGTIYSGGSLRGSSGSATKLILDATSTTTELHAAGTTGIIFKNNGNNERMRLTDTGLGIGTTSPNSPLEIHGADIATSTTTTSASVLRMVRDVVDPSYSLRKDSAAEFRLSRQQAVANNLPYTRLDIRLAGVTDSSTPSLDVMSLMYDGRVGIGTTSPSDLLTITGDGKYVAHHDGTNYAFRLGADSSGDGVLILSDSSGTEKVKLYAEANSANYINNGGNFGVGTSSPSQKLTVNGNIYAISGIINVSAYQLNGTYVMDSSRNLVNIGTISSGAITSTGSSTFADTLTVSGATQGGIRLISANTQTSFVDFGDAQDNNVGLIAYDHSANEMFIRTNATEAVRIDSSQRVGIGTSSPDTTLDVTAGGVAGIILNQDTTNSAVSSRLFFKDSTRTNAIINVNGNLELRTGATIGSSSGTQRLGINGSSGAVTFNSAYTFPTADGSANQVLQTDGSGNLSFATVTSGGGVTVSNNADNRVLTGDGTNANAEANLTFDGSTLSVTGDMTMAGSSPTLSIPAHSGIEIDITGSASSGNIRANTDLYLLSQNGSINLGANGTNSILSINTSGNASFTGNLGVGRAADASFDLDVDGTSKFRGATTHNAGIQISNTTVIDASRNLTNIGTISSGAITSTGALSISGGATRINMQEDHYVNRRFDLDSVDNNGTIYVLLCEDAANNDVNGTIKMDRTSGLRHACSVDILISSGNASTPVGTIRSMGAAGGGTPTYSLVKGTHTDTKTYIALKIVNPDNYYETSGAYFTGRIKTTVSSNEFLGVTTLTSISNFSANGKHQVDNLTISGTATASGTIAYSPSNGGDLTLSSDSSYGTVGSGEYVTLGFGGKSNGYNRIFGGNTTDGGLFIASATGRNITFRTNGGSANTFAMTSGGLFQVNDTTILDQSRNLTNIGTISSGAITTTGNVSIADSQYLYFGASNDFFIQHNTTNTILEGVTGDIIIQNNATDKDIVFKSDDGSGGMAEYFRLDGSEVQTKFAKSLKLSDSVYLRIGNDNDMQLYHDGSNSYIANNTGNLQFDAANDIIIDAGGGDVVFRDDSVEFGRILNTSGSMTLHAVTQDTDILFRGNDGGSTITALTLDMSNAGAATFNSGITTSGAITAGAAAIGNTGEGHAIGHEHKKEYYYDEVVGDADGTDIKWTLKDANGNDLTTTTQNKVYRVRLVTLGTGTDTGAVYLADNVDGNGWRVNAVNIHQTPSNEGSNYPFLELDSGVPKVSLNHNNTYTVRIFVEEYNTGNSGGHHGIFGTDHMLTAEYASKYLGVNRSDPSYTLDVGGSIGINGTNIITSSRNMLNIGSISSGAITSTGTSTFGTLNATEFDGHIEAGANLDINVGTNYGTTTTPDRLWISSFNTGQSDVPVSYLDVINLSTSSTHGIQIASQYGSTAGVFYMRNRSDNSNSPAGVGLQAWKRLYHQDFHPEADTLTTARTIGGVSFDGSANIDLPGVNTAGNQNTSGTAAGLSGTPNITVGTISSGAITSTGSSEVANLTVTGNLTVQGTTTTLETATLNVEDKNITLNYSSGDSSGSANGAGITIQDAVNSSTDATILWDSTNDEFDFSHSIKVAGSIGVTNIVTNKVVKYNGSTLDDSNITDTGSAITLGSNTTVSGNVTHNGLTMTSGTDIDQLTTTTVTATLSTSWQDTGIDGTDLATGTYIVQVFVDDHSVGGNHYDEYYSGIMSWFSTNTNSTATDEILLHRAGHAPNNGDFFLRTERTVNADSHDLMLQMRGSTSNSGNSDYIFKFRRMI
jgi:hypothetical protein